MGAQATKQQETVGYVELVRTNKKFRLLWLGQIVSLLGDWFNLIASAALIAGLTNSGAALGGLFVVRMLAPFLISPIAGVAADRYNRKTLLILTDIVRGLTVLGFLLVQDASDVWLVYALSAVQAGVSGFFFPARNAILPDITSKRELGAANALGSTTWSVMLAFGAALGGLFAGSVGIYPAFVLDSITFFISAVIIVRIVYDRPPALDSTDKTIMAGLRQYVDGLRYLRQHIDIFFVALHKAANGLFISGGFQVVQVVLAERNFVIGEGGAISMGLMYAAAGVGTGIGPIMARYFTKDRDRPLRVALAISYLITIAGLVLTATLANFPIVLIGTVLRGVGGGIGWVFSTQLLMQLLPAQVRGRVFSSEFAMFTLMNAIGAASAGWMLDANFTIPAMLELMAVLSLVPAVLWVAWIVFGKRARPADEPESAADIAEEPIA